ncbi:MAG TPA: hypothetical protein VKB38_18315 [Terracidiphilus sp.]|nr:hypothetical protein [Terracidiphilus sp.]
MKSKIIVLGIAAGAMYWACAAVGQPSQGFAPSGVVADAAVDSVLSESAISNAPDAKLYAEGAKAIHDGKWPDAVKLFERVAGAKGPHAAGALYWKAYALNKMGEPDRSVNTCAELREQFIGSTWIDDCGALEIEIASSKGKVVQPQPGQSDELKLLALATLVQKDPNRARAQIDEIVQGDSSEKLKEGALFILGENVPDATYPEIVRISFLEGDVRIARESSNEKGKDVTWENAVMNLPLETGDSLVTGKDGRVEIELEDASTMYLAENSVMTFEDMHSTGGVPHTELALVSGATTLHLDSLMPGESFRLQTPRNELVTRYPHKSDMRVTSFVDGMAITPLKSGSLNVTEVAGLSDSCDHADPKATCSGKTGVAAGSNYAIGEDHQLTDLDPKKAGDYAAFDAWVADRYAARTADVAAVMKDAGLSRPIPGLADMKGKGSFYDCQPYGKCWTPTPQRSMVSTGANQTAAMTDWNDWFPCAGMVNGAFLNPLTAQMMMANYPLAYMSGYGMGMMDPMAWAMCHAGWWVPNNTGTGYAWVAGHRLHHNCPVRWVKFGKTVAFVPLHPRDVKGQLPINRAHGFEPVKEKGGFKLNRVNMGSAKSVEAMKEAPRDFRSRPAPVLARAQAPQMEAHSIKGTPVEAGLGKKDGGIGLPRPGAMPLTFSRQQGFTTSHQVMQGGRTVTVNSPVGRPGGGSGPAMGGGGFSGGGHAGFGAGMGGGGARAGGGGGFSGGGGGGGSRGGAGGSAPAASSSGVSAPAASAAPAASGGSHH